MSDDSELADLAPDSESVASYYDAWAGVYDLDVVQWGYQAPGFAAAALADSVAVDQPIIDVGCGTGLTGLALSHAGFQIIDGVDISEPSLIEAASRTIYRDLGIADIQAPPLPLASDGYAGAVCIGVATYVADVGVLFDELIRVVEPGGTIVVTQRTDLWDERMTTEAVELRTVSGAWSAQITGVQPYLPGHPDYGTDVEIRYVIATVTQFEPASG